MPTSRSVVDLLLREPGAEVPQARVVAEAARHQQHTHVVVVTVVRVRAQLFDTVPQHRQVAHIGSIPRNGIQVPLGVALEAALVAVSLPTKGLVVLSCEFVEGLRPAPLYVVDLVDRVLRGNRISGARRHRRGVVPVTASARWRGGSTSLTRRCPHHYGVWSITYLTG